PSVPQPKPGPASPVAPEEMVYVPGGTFMMGSDNSNDKTQEPAHKVSVNPFFIDVHEVTNEQYQQFVDKTGHGAPRNWNNKKFPDGKNRWPVTDVTWDDANDYSRWAGKRLPTEEEWEFAARGTDGRKFPWGNDWQPGLANADNADVGITEVGKYKGASPFGLVD